MSAPSDLDSRFPAEDADEGIAVTREIGVGTCGPSTVTCPRAHPRPRPAGHVTWSAAGWPGRRGAELRRRTARPARHRSAAREPRRRTVGARRSGRSRGRPRERPRRPTAAGRACRRGARRPADGVRASSCWSVPRRRVEGSDSRPACARALARSRWSTRSHRLGPPAGRAQRPGGAGARVPCWSAGRALAPRAPRAPVATVAAPSRSSASLQRAVAPAPHRCARPEGPALTMHRSATQRWHAERPCGCGSAGGGTGRGAPEREKPRRTAPQVEHSGFEPLDLLGAIQALSQLSNAPRLRDNCIAPVTPSAAAVVRRAGR